MKQIFTRRFLNKVKKSRTMLFNLFVGFVGILEYNMHLFYDMLGEHYPVAFIIVATIGMYLRTITTESLEDKE